MEDLKTLMAQQDQRYQGMLNQVMETVMGMQQKSLGPQQFLLDPTNDASMEASEFTKSEVKDMTNQGFTREEIAKMNGDYYEERLRERAYAEGVDYDHLLDHEKRRLQEEL